MDLRDAIDEWIKWRSCERVIGGGADDLSHAIRDQVAKANEQLTRLTLLAEAAIEHCEAVRSLVQIREGLLPSAAEAWQEANDTYRRWLELRESMRSSGIDKKE